jgi:hypothetical protein
LIPVIVESPFAGDLERNRKYLDACLADCYRRGEAPHASHAIGPRALDDRDPEQRRKGIEAGYAWWPSATRIVFYIDHGMSSGMQASLTRAGIVGAVVEFRFVDGWNPKTLEVKR